MEAGKLLWVDANPLFGSMVQHKAFESARSFHMALLCLSARPRVEDNVLVRHHVTPRRALSRSCGDLLNRDMSLISFLQQSGTSGLWYAEELEGLKEMMYSSSRAEFGSPTCIEDLPQVSIKAEPARAAEPSATAAADEPMFSLPLFPCVDARGDAFYVGK